MKANDLNDNITFTFNEDSYFSELRETEVLKERLQLLGMVDPLVGKYFSTEYIKKNILQQSDDEIAQIKAQNDAEQREAEMKAAEMAPPPGMPMPGAAPPPAPPA